MISVIAFWSNPWPEKYSTAMWAETRREKLKQLPNLLINPHLPSPRPDQTGCRNCAVETTTIWCFPLLCFIALLLACIVCILDCFVHGHNPSQSPKVGSEEQNLFNTSVKNKKPETILKPWLEAGAVFFVKNLEFVDKVNKLFVFRVVFVQAAVASSWAKGSVNLLRQRLHILTLEHKVTYQHSHGRWVGQP